MPEINPGQWLAWVGFKSPRDTSEFDRPTNENSEAAVREAYLKNPKDKRCSNALFACGYYGDLRVGQLLCLFGGDPGIIAESIVKYQELGYIAVEEKTEGDFNKFLRKVHDVIDVAEEEQKNWEILASMSTEPDDMDVKLILTPMGTVAARLLTENEASEANRETNRQ